MSDDDTPDLPVGLSNDIFAEFEDTEEEKPKEEPEDIRTDHEKMRDFFFPKSESDGTWGKCECGKDTANDAGKHSSWCKKRGRE